MFEDIDTDPPIQKWKEGPKLHWPIWLLGAVALIGFTVAFVALAKADDPWVNSPNKTWYENAELTPDAKKKFGFEKCCNQSEVIRTKFQQRGESWWWLDKSSSTWREIPSYIIWYDKHPPNNEPTLFMWNGQLTCMFIPDPET